MVILSIYQMFSNSKGAMISREVIFFNAFVYSLPLSWHKLYIPEI